MAGRQIRESVTVAGRAERARVARAFAVGVLGPGHPCRDDRSFPVLAQMPKALAGLSWWRPWRRGGGGGGVAGGR
jgi:hypothetical protein